MSFGFLRPELLSLALPIAYLMWRTRLRQSALTLTLRAIAAVALLFVLAGLHGTTVASGHTTVFVVDRSASMPADAAAEAVELVDLAIESKPTGDTIRVFGFGESTAIEPTVSDASRGFAGFTRDVGQDGSDLASALEAALAVIPEGASGSITVLSDGEVDGAAGTEALALRAAARGVRIDVRGLNRVRAADTGIERLELPDEVDVGEPFFVTAWVTSDRAAERTLRLSRGDEEIARRTVALPRGRSRVRFPARATRAGISAYRVDILGIGEDDRLPENDTALAALRASGPRPILVINHDGREDTLSSALRQAGIPVTTLAPEATTPSVPWLESWRGVIIENVSAARLGLDRMNAVRTWVRDHGGGLLMTGGQASFGNGGYFRSPLDGVLPVSMELRQEHRKLSLAMSIVLDRSGSMGAPVDGGRTKMDLANAGTVEALELLSPSDSVSVIAVDSAPHVIQEQTELTDPNAVKSKVRRIQSMGGGIFTAVGLEAAAVQLEGAAQVSRHVILFADAADAEQYQETPARVKLLRKLGATISVIALGTDRDTDAAFLRDDVADKGGGEIYFTQSAAELPRLFAMETQAVARSTFVEEPTGVLSQSELYGLGEIEREPFPNLDGYNLTYLGEGASLGAVTTDEYAAPVVAFHQSGLGRAAALTLQLGGGKNAGFFDWEGSGSLLVTLARWLAGVEAPAGVFASAERDGRDAVFTVEIDPTVGPEALGDSLTAVLTPESGGRVELELERLDDVRFVGRAQLPVDEVALATVVLGASGTDGPRAVQLPPLVVPYSPEFERKLAAGSGERLLERLARRTGGVTNASASDVMRPVRDSSAERWTLWSKPLLVLAIMALVLEVAVRRLGLGHARRRSIAARAGDESRPSPPAGSSRASSSSSSPPGSTSENDPGEGEPLESALERARRASRNRLA